MLHATNMVTRKAKPPRPAAEHPLDDEQASLRDSPRQFKIGRVLVDPESNRIGETRVDAKAMDVLELLASQAPHPIPSIEIMAAVWRNADVGDNVLHQAIAHIRKALDDDPRHPRHLETVPRKGYRLLHEVQFQHTTPARHPSYPEVTVSRRSLAVCTGMVACILLGGTLLATWAGVPSGEPRILPIHANTTPIPSEYTALVADSITSHLVIGYGLRLVGAFSTVRSAAPDQVGQLADRLQATHLLEVAVHQASQTKISVNVRLVESDTETILWVARYDLAPIDDFHTRIAYRVGKGVASAMDLSRGNGENGHNKVEDYEPFQQSDVLPL